MNLALTFLAAQEKRENPLVTIPHFKNEKKKSFLREENSLHWLFNKRILTGELVRRPQRRMLRLLLGTELWQELVGKTVLHRFLFS